ncbi:uncharacterized protein [Labrus bergylta]|uniref:uncharacterized protein n=1 Tax=Labrus bergylta TaxID=56723 RepID=UPI0033135985
MPVNSTTACVLHSVNSCTLNLNSLSLLKKASSPHPSFTFGLWNCLSTGNKTEFIQAFAKMSDLQALALTESWIRPENRVTPAALSVVTVFSHTPRPVGCGGGTSILISNTWKFNKLFPLSNNSSFEYHTIMVTAPIKMYIAIIYRPPGCNLNDFVVELDMVLSEIPDYGTPLIVIGDMNIHTDKAQATDFLALLSSFDLTQVPTPPTHKAGNTLDLILTQNCLTVTPLHLSDHFFIQSIIILPELPLAHPQMVSYHQNMRSLKPAQLSNEVMAAMPAHKVFTALSTEEATDTLCSTLASSLHKLCPLVSKPARKTLPSPWLTEVIREQRAGLRSAERKWQKSKQSADLNDYKQRLVSFSSIRQHIIRTRYAMPQIQEKCYQAIAFPESWIHPENRVTPAALSVVTVFSHTPCSVGRGGGTGILIFNTWKFNKLFPLSNNSSFEYHTIMVSAPIKMYIAIIYQPKVPHSTHSPL